MAQTDKGYTPWDPTPVVDRNTGEVLFGRQDKYGRWPEKQAAEGARPWEDWMGRGGYTLHPGARGAGAGYITSQPKEFIDTRGDYGTPGARITPAQSQAGPPARPGEAPRPQPVIPPEAATPQWRPVYGRGTAGPPPPGDGSPEARAARMFPSSSEAPQRAACSCAAQKG
jgi:hypothetical protein